LYVRLSQICPIWLSKHISSSRAYAISFTKIKKGFWPDPRPNQTGYTHLDFNYSNLHWLVVLQGVVQFTNCCFYMLTLSKSQNLFLKKRKKRNLNTPLWEITWKGNELNWARWDPLSTQKSVPPVQGSRSSRFWVLAFQNLRHEIMTKNQPNLTQKQLKKLNLERKWKGKIK
jgi:hypothetical protein